MLNWQPKEGSSSCSKHFHNNDFNESKQSLETIKNETVFLIEKGSDDLDAPAILKVCRVCLAMDVKMYYMSDHNLQQMYEQAIGMLLGDDKLPQMFCWECAQRLINGSKFRTKALKTQMLLTEMLNNDKCITIRGIKSINRTENDLKSSLIKTSYDVNNFNVVNVIYDDDVKSDLGDSRDAFDENSVSQGSEETTKKGLQDIKIKDEPNYDSDGSDVDLKLSDIAIEATGRERRVLVKIERVDDHEQIMDNVDQAEHARKRHLNKERQSRFRVRQRFESPSTSSHQAQSESYKTSDVKSLPSKGSLDELTVTPITYEEPIVVVEVQPDLASYINTARRDEISKANLCGDYGPDEPTSDEHVGAPAIRNKHIGDKPYKCDVCDYRCSKKFNLTVHLRKHTGDKPYKCDICDYRCSKKYYLNVHLRKHTEDKPFKCDICDYICSKKFHLNEHLSKHTEGKPHKCDICDYRCAKKYNLNVHIRKHTGDKPYKCDICDYSCSKKYNLNVHLRKHTGDKPYKCDICDYRFSKKYHFNVHLRKHTGEKPYKCDICDYRFSQKYNLNVHLRKHTGDKPFKCDICDFRCTQKCSLLNHMNTH